MDERDSLTRLILTIWGKARNHSIAECAKIGLQMTEARILVSLSEQEGVTQKEIGIKSNMNKTFVMRTISSLVKKGLVERRKDQRDNRANYIYFTEAGQEKMADVFKSLKSSDENLFSFLDESEMEIFHIILRRVADGLADLPETFQENGQEQKHVA